MYFLDNLLAVPPIQACSSQMEPLCCAGKQGVITRDVLTKHWTDWVAVRTLCPVTPGVTRPSRGRFSSCARRRQGSSLRSARACHAARPSGLDGASAQLTGRQLRDGQVWPANPPVRQVCQELTLGCVLQGRGVAQIPLARPRVLPTQDAPRAAVPRLHKRNRRLRRSLERSGVGTPPTSAPLN